MSVCTVCLTGSGDEGDDEMEADGEDQQTPPDDQQSDEATDSSRSEPDTTFVPPLLVPYELQ